MPKNSILSVISGQFKGVKLQSPQASSTHPMGAREKVALFNMLQPYLADATVLDAYAGSGALGIEALSRGATEVVFVEKSPQVARIITQNLAKIPTKSQVLTEDIAKFAQNLAFRDHFDVIIADPPYDGFQPEKIAELTSTLKPGGILALSFPFVAGTPEFSDLSLLKSHKYAAAGIAIYHKN